MTAWTPNTPADWRVYPAHEVCDIVSGGTPKTSEEANWGGGIIWVTPDDQGKGSVDTLVRGRRTITEAGLASSSAKLVPAGSVLLSSRAPIGYVSIAGCELATNQGFKTFVPKPDVELEPAFLLWWLRFSRSNIEALGSGTTFKELSKRAASTIPIPLPGVEEQRAIVEAIERMLTRLEALDQITSQLSRRLGLLTEATVGVAVSGSWPKPVGVDALAELREVSRNPARVQTKVDEQPQPEWLPEGWAWVTLRTAVGDDGLIADGDWVETKDQDPEGAIRLLQLSDIGRRSFRDRSNRFINEDTADRLGVTDVEAGDVLVSRLGDPPGAATQVPNLGMRAITAVDVCIIRSAEGAVSPEWLMQCINSPRFRAAIVRHQSGTTRKRISRSKLEQLCVPVPPRTEQQGILEELGRRLSKVSHLEASLEAHGQRQLALRRSIVMAAFEGRLTAESSATPSDADLDKAIA